MRFAQAWAEVIRFNQSLKISLGVCILTSIILGITTIHFSMKSPLIIERACYSKVIDDADETPSKIEYESFIELALKQRFNTTEKVIEGHLSIDEKKNKLKEQLTLSKNKIIQFVIVRSIIFKAGYFLIEADRLYAVDQIRSTLPIKLKVTLKSKDRTETNPYGLILDKTEEIKIENDEMSGATNAK